MYTLLYYSYLNIIIRDSLPAALMTPLLPTPKVWLHDLPPSIHRRWLGEREAKEFLLILL